MIDNLSENTRVVGIKQTKKAITEGRAKAVLIAKDADSRVSEPLLELCEKGGISVTLVDTMRELGTACGIDVGAAAVAIL